MSKNNTTKHNKKQKSSRPASAQNNNATTTQNEAYVDEPDQAEVIDFFAPLSSQEPILLSDEQVQRFLVDGFIIIKPKELPFEFHQQIYTKSTQILQYEQNYGNNILPRIPELNKVYESPSVKGALISLLGKNFTMQPHRFPHLSEPGNAQQQWHKDSFFGYKKPLRHNQIKYVMAMYYPQKVENNGPTAIKRSTQYYSQDPKRYRGDLTNNYKGDDVNLDLLGTVQAGSVLIIHYDLVHRATTNKSEKGRIMFKFQFNRLEDPVAPTWDCKNKEWNGTIVPRPTTSSESTEGSKSILSKWVAPIAYYQWKWLCGETKDFETSKSVSKNFDPSLSDEELEKLLEDKNSEAARFYASYCLALKGKFNVLIKRLFIKNQEFRNNATYALPACASVDCLKALINLLNSTETSRPRAGSSMAAEETPGGRPKQAENNAVYHTAHVLCEMGPKAIEAVPSLIPHAQCDDGYVRLYVAEALGSLCAVSSVQKEKAELVEKAVNCLNSMLGDADPHVRLTVALAIARIGAPAQACVPRLSMLLMRDTNRYVVGNSVLALEKIGTPEALRIVLDYYRVARWCPFTTKKKPF